MRRDNHKSHENDDQERNNNEDKEARAAARSKGGGKSAVLWTALQWSIDDAGPSLPCAGNAQLTTSAS